jgi:hypothetical protein
VSAETYANALPGRHSIGSHLRHAIEHFQCFFAGVGDGLVDYDSRARDESIERSADRCRGVLGEVCDHLRAMGGDTLSRPVRVRQSASLDEAPGVYDSSVQRELVFLSSHAIHHLAVVVHLCSDHGVDLPEEISLAFSTAVHQQAVKR